MDRLAREGFEIYDVRPAMSLDDDAFRAPLAEAWGVIAGNMPIFGAELLDLAPNLKIICKMGVGLDNIDVNEAKRRGVLVCNSPGVNTLAVADYAMGLILALARQIVIADAEVRAGRWPKLRGWELNDRTLGLFGLGAIGQAVAVRAKAFGMKVAAHDVVWPEEFAMAQGIEHVAPEELFARADVLSLHCPLLPETRGIINARTLALMKPTALIINTARGGLIDDDALYNALNDGTIAGAGLDAFQHEPLENSPFVELKNVILSPHTAWFTQEAMIRMSESVVEQLIKAHCG